MTLTPPTSGRCQLNQLGGISHIPSAVQPPQSGSKLQTCIDCLSSFHEAAVTPAGNGGVIHRKLPFPCASGPSLGFCAVLLVGLRTGQRRAEAWRHAPTPPGSSGREGALRPPCSPGNQEEDGLLSIPARLQTRVPGRPTGGQQETAWASCRTCGSAARQMVKVGPLASRTTGLDGRSLGWGSRPHGPRGGVQPLGRAPVQPSLVRGRAGTQLSPGSESKGSH